MRLIDAEELLNMPFLNGQYDKKNANRHFVSGILAVKEMIENMPIVVKANDYNLETAVDNENMKTDIKLKKE